MEEMRRALASLLLVLFSVTLSLPLLLAEELNLPSCCRRLGKHHCSMEDSGPAEGLRAAQPKCCSYPSTTAAPGNWTAAFFSKAVFISASLLTYPPVEARAEAHYRVSFSRSRQKRGPPSPIS